MSVLRYREELADRIVAEIAERCGCSGCVALTVEQMEPCFAQFGARLRWVPRDVLPTPVVRNGIVLMPDGRATEYTAEGRSLRGWMAHELAEVVLGWEGTRTYLGPGWSADRDRIASLVEARLLGRELAAGRVLAMV